MAATTNVLNRLLRRNPSRISQDSSISLEGSIDRSYKKEMIKLMSTTPQAGDANFSENLSERVQIHPNQAGSSVSSKYADVWQRARNKIRIELTMLQLKGRVRHFGTLAHSLGMMLLGTSSIPEMIKIRAEKAQTTVPSGDRQLPFLVIHPYSTSKELWTLFINLLLLYTVTVMPFTMAFMDIQLYSPLWCFDVSVDLVFVVDMLANFTTAYFDTEGELVNSRTALATHYAKSWFFLDFSATVPCIIINFASGSPMGGYSWLIRLARTPRLYRVLRISRLLKIVKNYKHTVLVERLQDLFKVNIGEG